MKTNGRKITCDLCGAETFVKTTGERELDGGFTRYNLFEHAEGWSNTLEFGDMCPECTAEYEKLQQEFKERKLEFKERTQANGRKANVYAKNN